MKTKRTHQYYLLLSALSLIVLVVIIWFFPMDYPSSFYDKLVTGVAFCGSCLLGVSLTVRPNWMRRYISRSSPLPQRKTTKNHAEMTFRGHHPACTPFRSHVISIRGNIRCGGCLGLALGAGASLVLFVVYLFVSPLSFLVSHVMFLTGVCLIPLSLAATKNTARHSMIRVILNFVLIVGFLFITLSILEITARPSFAMLAVLFSWLWIALRKELSLWNHHTICQSCSRTCKMY